MRLDETEREMVRLVRGLALERVDVGEVSMSFPDE